MRLIAVEPEIDVMLSMANAATALRLRGADGRGGQTTQLQEA